jgi:DNA polymerase III subunit delta
MGAFFWSGEAGGRVGSIGHIESRSHLIRCRVIDTTFTGPNGSIKECSMPPKKSAVAAKNSQIYAVVGSDEAAVKSRARELAQQLTPKDSGDFGQDLVDGSADNADQAVSRIHSAIEAVQTLPFFGSGKLVWLKDVTFCGDTVTGRSAQVVAALDELQQFLSAGLPAGVFFLLSASEIDKRRSFYKSITKIAVVEQFDRIDTSRSGWEEEAESLARGLAAERGLIFQAEALEIFVRLAGADTRQLRNELEKIDLYLGQNREIDSELVRNLVAKTATGVIWELGNAIAKRQLSRALALLDQLLFQGETPIGILYAAIIPTVRNLLVTKEILQAYGVKAPGAPYQFNSVIARLPQTAQNFLPRRKDGTVNVYGLGIAACEAHRFSLAQLVRGFEECLKANFQLVTTQLEPRLVLSKLLVSLLAP